MLLPVALAAVLATGAIAQFGHFKVAVLLACVNALLAGTFLLAVFGLRRAADWPAGRLAVGAGVAVALFVATLWSMVGGLQARVAAFPIHPPIPTTSMPPARVRAGPSRRRRRRAIRRSVAIWSATREPDSQSVTPTCRPAASRGTAIWSSRYGPARSM